MELPIEAPFAASFPLPYRVFVLSGLGILGWATNLHGLHALGIDASRKALLDSELFWCSYIDLESSTLYIQMLLLVVLLYIESISMRTLIHILQKVRVVAKRVQHVQGIQLLGSCVTEKWNGSGSPVPPTWRCEYGSSLSDSFVCRTRPWR